MYRIFLIFTILTSLVYSEQPLNFRVEETMLETHMHYIQDDQEQIIGSISVCRLSIFNAILDMDKSVLPLEVTEILDIVQTIKMSLCNDLKDVLFLGDLYIKPEFRKKGFAKLLVDNTCREIFEKKKAKFIALHLDPFEYKNGVQESLCNTLEYEAKQKLLCKLYERSGFVMSDEGTFMYLTSPS